MFKPRDCPQIELASSIRFPRMSDTSSRPAAADRRERIVLAALRLFSEQPYGDVHMDGIAAWARVAKPTLYRYFATKEALFIAALEHDLGERSRMILRRGFASLREGIARLLADGIEDGELGGFDVDLAVLLVLGGVRMAAHSAAASRTDLARSLVDILLGGLRVRPRARQAAVTQSWSGA